MVDLEQYLQPTDFFDFHKPRVKNKALEITKGFETDKEKAISLFYWIRDTIVYKQGSFYLTKNTFKASTNLRRGYGFCVSKAILLSTFARAVNIPARIHLADIINHKTSKRIVELMGNIFYIHGYSELYLDGKWVKVTPAFDKDTSMKARYVLVEFDGENDALLSLYDNEGNLFVEYLKDRGVYVDVPYEEIKRVILKKYKNAIEKAFNKV